MGWVTLDDGQHVYIGAGGEFQPRGPTAPRRSDAGTVKPANRATAAGPGGMARAKAPGRGTTQRSELAKRIVRERSIGVSIGKGGDPKQLREHAAGWRASSGSAEAQQANRGRAQGLARAARAQEAKARSMPGVKVAQAAAAATIGPKAGETFSLATRSATGARGPENTGRGTTKFMFDMNRKDKPGQTSMFDKLEAKPAAAAAATTPPGRKLEPGEKVMHAATYRTEAKEYTVKHYDQRGDLHLNNPRTGGVSIIPARSVGAYERSAAATRSAAELNKPDAAGGMVGHHAEKPAAGQTSYGGLTLAQVKAAGARPERAAEPVTRGNAAFERAKAARAEPHKMNEGQFVATMRAHDTRQDMARGNAVKEVQSIAGVTAREATRTVESIEPTRAGAAHFERTGGNWYDKPTSGVTVGVKFLPTESVYRAAHQLAMKKQGGKTGRLF